MSVAVELWRALEAWDPDRHPRGPGGRFIRLGGGGHDRLSLADVVKGTAAAGPKRQRKGGQSVADAVRAAARRSDTTGRPTQRTPEEHRAHGAHDVADEVDRALADAGASKEVQRAVSGRARARAETHGPRPGPARPGPTTANVPEQAPDTAPTPGGKVPTWEELGRPQGPSPVGQVIGHEGGTYERLPGEQRRYRVVSSDGRVLTENARTADDARTALRVDAHDRGRVAEDKNSAWRKTLSAVSGSWSYDTGKVEGFDSATPAERQAITDALERWTRDKANLRDASRTSEPRVNMAIRGATPRTGEVEQDIRALDLAFTMSKTKRGATVYRGFSNGAHVLPGGWQSRDLTGLEWSTEGFTPTTADKTVAEEYIGFTEHGGFGVRLNLPKGSPAIAITDAVGGLDNEGEVLLPRGLKFRVVKDNGKQGPNGNRWLDVELVPDGAPTRAEPPAASHKGVAATRPDSRAAKRPFTDSDAAAVSAKLEAASTRDEAHGHLAGLTVPQLRHVAKLTGVSVRSNDTKPKLAGALVEGLAGRRLDSAALSKKAHEPKPAMLSGPHPEPPKATAAADRATVARGADALKAAPVSDRRSLAKLTTKLVPITKDGKVKAERDIADIGGGVSGGEARDALGDYSDQGYQYVNDALRLANGDASKLPDSVRTGIPGHYTKARAEAQVRGIDALMARSELKHDVVVWRGVADPSKAMPGWKPGGDNTGLEFTDHAYASTTVNEAAARKFAGNGAGVKMNILVPKGTGAVGIQNSQAGLRGERELLLQRGLRYRVVADRVVDGVRTIDVDVVPA